MSLVSVHRIDCGGCRSYFEVSCCSRDGVAKGAIFPQTRGMCNVLSILRKITSQHAESIALIQRLDIFMWDRKGAL